MKRIVTFCALCALWGCRTVVEPSGEVIALSYSTSEQSKTDVLTQGDEIGVFSNIEGTEQYFLDNVKFVVGSDGRSLSTTPAVYYPEAKQAVAFTAYLPFGGTWSGGVGTFSVPSDQSTAAALKQADLCWAMASSTPVASAVPLEFTHQMARLLVTTNSPTTTPTAKIVAPNVFSGGTLDIRTGTFTNTTKSTILTTGTGTGMELILPAQTITRLVLTVAGVEYVFEGVISLEAAKTTTLNLTLHPTTHTATLSGSSTTHWVSSASEGHPTQAVSNVLTMHWPNYLPQGATPDKVVLTINNVDYTVSSGITYANQTFTVPFASSVLRYPYTITKIAFYQGATQVWPNCTQLLGSAICKSGASIVGIKDRINAVLINGLWWAEGNLIADGPNSCKIGTTSDCGLYFQFGSLIGWAGGAAPNYNGTGAAQVSTCEVKVKPLNLHLSFDPIAQFPSGASTLTINKSYFGVTVSPYNLYLTNIREYADAPMLGPGVDLTKTNLGTGRYAPAGVGDPCTFYLGGSWRLPTENDWRLSLKERTVSRNPNTAIWTYNGTTVVFATTGGRAGGTIGFSAISYINSFAWLQTGTTGTVGCMHSILFVGSASWNSGVSNQFRDMIDLGGDYNARSSAWPVRCVAN